MNILWRIDCDREGERGVHKRPQLYTLREICDAGGPIAWAVVLFG